MASKERSEPQWVAPSNTQDVPPDYETIGTIFGYALLALSWLLIIVTFPFSMCLCLKVIKEYERVVIFRIGRLVFGGARGPGMIFVIPCVDTYRKIDLRVVSYAVPPQEILSKDSGCVDAVVYFRTSDPIASVNNVDDAIYSTKLLAQTTLRNALGMKTLTEMLTEREAIAQLCETILDEGTEHWGVKKRNYLIGTAEAAREARAKVVAAEGEQKASRALKEAADVIQANPVALQLRHLQALNSIAAEHNSTIDGYEKLFGARACKKYNEFIDEILLRVLGDQANRFLAENRSVHRKFGVGAERGQFQGNSIDYAEFEFVRTEKLNFIISYFNSLSHNMPEGMITILRQSTCSIDFSLWDASLADVFLDNDNVIENCIDEAHVDFANKLIGGGVFSQGCLQEEIRFLISPECLISCLLCEMLNDNEAILILGAQRFSFYEGYGNTFKYVGGYRNRFKLPRTLLGHHPTEIIAIDALPFEAGKQHEQFYANKINRELKKAFIGFAIKTPNTRCQSIATGNWGCGAFGGNLELKSASLTGRDLHYFTFKNYALGSSFAQLKNMLEKRNLTFDLGEKKENLDAEMTEKSSKDETGDDQSVSAHSSCAYRSSLTPPLAKRRNFTPDRSKNTLPSVFADTEKK
ncbi:CBN-UNC-1 protein [Aphelenchoides besseyi]|nr:CBN-UNC-1 protein [Aphelenchoides besseyi]